MDLLKIIIKVYIIINVNLKRKDPGIPSSVLGGINCCARPFFAAE